MTALADIGNSQAQILVGVDVYTNTVITAGDAVDTGFVGLPNDVLSGVYGITVLCDVQDANPTNELQSGLWVLAATGGAASFDQAVSGGAADLDSLIVDGIYAITALSEVDEFVVNGITIRADETKYVSAGASGTLSFSSVTGTNLTDVVSDLVEAQWARHSDFPDSSYFTQRHVFHVEQASDDGSQIGKRFGVNPVPTGSGQSFKFEPRDGGGLTEQRKLAVIDDGASYPVNTAQSLGTTGQPTALADL